MLMKKLAAFLEANPWLMFVVALTLGTLGMYWLLNSVILAVFYFVAGLAWARLQTSQWSK